MLSVLVDAANAKMHEFAYLGSVYPSQDGLYFTLFLGYLTASFLNETGYMLCKAMLFMQPFAGYFLLGANYLVSVSGWLASCMYLNGVPDARGRKGDRRANQKQRKMERGKEKNNKKRQ